MSGDGLIGQVGGELANTDSALGIIPGGRGNDFARVVGIPDDVEEAAGIVAGGATRQIDVGEANGVRYLCIASCGFDSEANRIANEAKRVKGPVVYAYAALRALAAWKPATFTLTLDGERVEVTGLHGRRCEHEGVRRRHDRRAHRRARRRLARGGGQRQRLEAALPARASARSSRASTSRRGGPDLAGERGARSRRTGRSPSTPTAIRSQTSPSTVRILPSALRVIVPPDSAP